MKKAQTMFPGGIAILSNSAGSSDDEGWKMASKTEQNIGIPVIRHMVKKPGCINEVLTHFEQSLQKNILPQEICVVGKQPSLNTIIATISNCYLSTAIIIGDRVMTDVVFANQYNMLSVLVDPISHTRDHPVAMVFRILELHLLLPIIKWYIQTFHRN